MSKESFEAQVKRLWVETLNEYEAAGRPLDMGAMHTAMYEKIFGETPPAFAPTLTGEEIALVIGESFRREKSLREFTTIEFLNAQYQAKFERTLGYNFMTITTEEELLSALRESLQTGKPHELPAEMLELVAQGVLF